MQQYISILDAAERLGLSEATIRRYVRSGVIQGFRIPGSPLIRIKAAELDAILEPVVGRDA